MRKLELALVAAAAVGGGACNATRAPAIEICEKQIADAMEKIIPNRVDDESKGCEQINNDAARKHCKTSVKAAVEGAMSACMTYQNGKETVCIFEKREPNATVTPDSDHVSLELSDAPEISILNCKTQ